MSTCLAIQVPGRAGVATRCSAKRCRKLGPAADPHAPNREAPLLGLFRATATALHVQVLVRLLQSMVRFFRVPLSFQIQPYKASRHDNLIPDKGASANSNPGVEVMGERRYRRGDLSFRGAWTRRAPGSCFYRKRLMHMTHQLVIVP